MYKAARVNIELTKPLTTTSDKSPESNVAFTSLTISLIKLGAYALKTFEHRIKKKPNRYRHLYLIKYLFKYHNDFMKLL